MITNHFHLCYETFGQPAHPAVILITGLSGQLIGWPPLLIQSLTDRGFFVVVFDNRDAGLSKSYDEEVTPSIESVIAAKKQNQPIDLPYTLDDMAADVISLMDHLNLQQSHIMGISMGGVIAQVVAQTYTARVLSLILIASTTSSDHLPPAEQAVLQLLFTPHKSGDHVEAYIESKFALHKIYNHPDYIDETESRLFFEKSYRRAYKPAGVQRQLSALITYSPEIESFKQIYIPTLIIHGDRDPVFSIEHAEHLRACFPKSRLEIVKNMGHGLPPGICERVIPLIINFLNEQI